MTDFFPIKVPSQLTLRNRDDLDGLNLITSPLKPESILRLVAKEKERVKVQEGFHMPLKT